MTAPRSDPGSVIAAIGTDADDRTVDRAIAIALDGGLRLVLVDRSAESIVGATPYNDLRGDDDFRPVPDQTVGSALARREGRNELARYIESAERSGVDVGGWFPTKAGLDGIREAINRFQGSVLVVPGSVRSPSIGERFRGVDVPSLEELGIRVVIADA